MIWTLILMLTAPHGVAMTTVTGFPTVQACSAAGQQAKRVAPGFADVAFVCVPVMPPGPVKAESER